MQDKTNAVFDQNQVESQIAQLEAQAKQIISAIARRVVVMSTFPNNLLNQSYQRKNEQALTVYGRKMAHARYLREQAGGNQAPERTAEKMVESKKALEELAA